MSLTRVRMNVVQYALFTSFSPKSKKLNVVFPHDVQILFCSCKKFRSRLSFSFVKRKRIDGAMGCP